jgi:hypothetical protein
MVLKNLAVAAALGASVTATGCATIVHSGPREIPVQSVPPGAKVSIYDRDNNLVETNTTPFVASLKPSAGYFKSQSYRLVFQMPGYSNSEVDLSSAVSGWYWGNLLFGGLIGMLAVDPATGAMFNLEPEKIAQHLTPASAAAPPSPGESSGAPPASR